MKKEDICVVGVGDASYHHDDNLVEGKLIPWILLSMTYTYFFQFIATVSALFQASSGYMI